MQKTVWVQGTYLPIICFIKKFQLSFVLFSCSATRAVQYSCAACSDTVNIN